MKTFFVSKPQTESIPINYLSANKVTNKVIIFVGGDGDDRYKFINIAKKLIAKDLPYNIATFSFRGVETNSRKPLKQQVVDLEEVIDFICHNKDIKTVVLICTSMGAYSSSLVLLNNKYKDIISQVIYLDPADFYISKDKQYDGGGTWAGYQEFKPKGKTASSTLNNIKSKVKIDVISFLLRNHGPDGYAPEDQRSKDNPKRYLRLNNDMVRSFYKNTPIKNRGKYIEDKKLPHAFVRDGDVRENELRIVELITECLVVK